MRIGSGMTSFNSRTITYPELRALAQKSSRNPYLLSMRVLSKFLGAEWVETHIKNKAAPTEFFANDRATDDRLIVHVTRVIDLAERMYNLQFVEGFEKCQGNLQSDPNIEGTVAELEVGGILRRRGSSFRFVLPRGEYGADYDLELSMPDGRKVFGETKCKVESTPFGKSTIKTSLNQARGQLPPDAPSIVFLKIPDGWLTVDSQWVFSEPMAEEFAKAVDAFLRNTGRVVSVIAFSSPIIQFEQHVGSGGCNVMPIENPYPRFPGNWELFPERESQGVLSNVVWVSFRRLCGHKPSGTQPPWSFR